MSESLQTLIRLAVSAINAEHDAWRNPGWKEREISAGEYESLRSWWIANHETPAPEASHRLLLAAVHDYIFSRNYFRIQGTARSFEMLKRHRIHLSQTLRRVRETQAAQQLQPLLPTMEDDR